MLSFKDFLAVSYTGETEQQDLNAKKRHRALGMWEDAVAQKEDGAGDPVDPNTGVKRMIVGEQEVDEHIVKVKDGYRLVSKKSGKNLGTYPTRAGAEKRERQVQYFKHKGE